VRRHRLNWGGNRQLNTALHLIAVCQIRDSSPGQCYYRRKLAQAKTPEEARCSLKRHLSNVVYSHLVTDHRHRTRAVDTQRRYQVTAAASTSAAMAAGAVDRSKTGHTWSNTEWGQTAQRPPRRFSLTPDRQG
jgi:hypothetical protein